MHWVSYHLSEELTDRTPGRPGSREYIYARERMLERLLLQDRSRAPHARRHRRAIRRVAAQGLRGLSALLTSTAEWLTRSDTIEGRGESLQVRD